MDLSKVPAGKDVPNEINAVIEIPASSAIKYELDENSGYMTVDRFMHTTMRYPFNYGFMPHTMADDGDPLDVLVLSTHPVMPSSVIAVRPVGMLEMEDEDGVDHKILSVPINKIDPFFADIKDITDINVMTLDSMKHFFERYKDLENNKWVKVNEFRNKEAAIKVILESQKK